MIFLFCDNNLVNITVQPMNATVCLTQSTTASFTCVVGRGSLSVTSAGWQIHLGGGVYAYVIGRNRHMTNATIMGDTLTDTLTVTDVSVNDNGAQYRCEPLSNVISDVVTITLLGT